MTLVFNEIVRGTFKDGSMDRYDDFYTLYEKVRDTVGNDLEHKQAKDALAVALRFPRHSYHWGSRRGFAGRLCQCSLYSP